METHSDSGSDSNYSSWRGGLDSTGEFNICMKRKINDLLKNYNYPSLSKAILNSKIELKDKVTLIPQLKKYSKKSVLRKKRINQR